MAAPSGLGEPYSFRFAFASCASTGSDHPVFDAIRAAEPQFFVHTGDLFYADNAAVRRGAGALPPCLFVELPFCARTAHLCR